MTMEEAIVIVENQRTDYKKTADNYESIFPGAVSAYHELIDAYTLAVEAMKKTIEEEKEDE